MYQEASLVPYPLYKREDRDIFKRDIFLHIAEPQISNHLPKKLNFPDSYPVLPCKHLSCTQDPATHVVHYMQFYTKCLPY